MSNLLQKLIQIASFSGQEQKLAQFIMAYCKKKGIPAFLHGGNVVIHIKGKDSHKALIFNAHLDTVGPGNMSKWRYPPYGPLAGKIINGKIYGLGSSDDKAAIAALLMVSKTGKPKVDLWLTFVTSEETDGSGTATFLDWFTGSKYYKKYSKISAIIGEPTGLEAIETGHRGNAFISLKTHGCSGHGAIIYKRHELAVEKMLFAIRKIKKSFKKWKVRYRDPILEFPGMNIISIKTDQSSPNQIPENCVVDFDFRTTPAFHENLEELIKGVIGPEIQFSFIKSPQPPAVVLKSSRIMAICKKVLPEVPLQISLGSTDLSQFSQKGIDVIVFGPGEKEVIHKENEYCILDKVAKSVSIYKSIIEEFAK